MFANSNGIFGFQNVLKISLSNHSTENIERNIFVTLSPSDSLDPYWFQATQVRIVLKNGSAVIDSDVIDLPISQDYVHDPNLLTIYRLNHNTIHFINEYDLLKYKVDFENTGTGNVYKVKAKVKIPEHADKELIVSSLRCNMGQVNFKDLNTAFIMQNGQTFVIITTESFTPQKILLWRNNMDATQISNQGFFEFLVKTPQGEEEFGKSKAELIFNNEQPVATNEAMVINPYKTWFFSY